MSIILIGKDHVLHITESPRTNTKQDLVNVNWMTEAWDSRKSWRATGESREKIVVEERGRKTGEWQCGRVEVGGGVYCEGFEVMEECVARGPHQVSVLKKKQAYEETREMWAAARTVTLGTQGRSWNEMESLQGCLKTKQKDWVTAFYSIGKEVLGVVIVH